MLSRRYIRLLWRGRYLTAAGWTPDQQDAYSAACWLQEADREGDLKQFFDPSFVDNVDNERAVAELEGWILGVR